MTTNQTPTKEQENCVNLVKNNSFVKIEAVSGSGKTTTLKQVSEALVMPTLYLAYNKAMADDAKGKFPGHVESRTTHSLAFASVGHTLAHKLKRPIGRYVNVAGTASEIAKYFKIPFMQFDEDNMITAAFLGLIIKDSVAKFEHSAEDTFDVNKHMPSVHVKDIEKRFGKSGLAQVKKCVKKYAKELWEKRINVLSNVLCTHDTYLKLYQLSKPDLSQQYKMLLLDEAQDTNDCVLDIVTTQKQKMKIVLVGDSRQQIYCQPSGTKVTVCDAYYKRGIPTTKKQVNIEDLKVGDLVLSYNLEKAHLNKTGKMVSHISENIYTGLMVECSWEGKTTKYTNDHEVIARLGSDNDDKYVTYLMRKGDNFRVGQVPWKYHSQKGNFGPGQRAATEGADSLWILGVHDTKLESIMQESLVSYKYGLPQVCFVNRARTVRELNGEDFWSKFGTNLESATKCLLDYGLNLSQPLWKKNTQGMSSVKFRTAFVTSAANLVSGMQLAYDQDIPSKGKIPLSCWRTIQVTKEYVENVKVYSMNIVGNHTYFGDNFLTHNCWRGAVNAMKKVDAVRGNLSKSFRYGEPIAAIAESILQGKVKIEGNEKVKSVTGLIKAVDFDKPYTILFRKNTTLVFRAIELITEGTKVSINIDVRDFVEMLNSAHALSLGEVNRVKHEDVLPYSSWEDFLNESKSSPDLAKLVKIIESGEAEQVINVLHTYKKDPDSQVTLTTAHRAKGLEYDQVVLADDFPSVYNTKGEYIGLTEEEENLLYVASTRAKYALNVNSTIQEILLAKVVDLGEYLIDYKREKVIMPNTINLKKTLGHFDGEDYVFD